MKKRSTTFIDALLANQPSELHIRSAFRNLGKAVLYSHQSIEEKRKKIERELADDSRITKHRFHL